MTAVMEHADRYLIEILGLEGTIHEGTIKTDKRMFVKNFDPDFKPADATHDATGMVYSTNNPNDAIQFRTVGEAYLYYQQQSKKYPLKPNGEPNRPLTVFNVEIVPMHEAVKVAKVRLQ